LSLAKKKKRQLVFQHHRKKGDRQAMEQKVKGGKSAQLKKKWTLLRQLDLPVRVLKDRATEENLQARGKPVRVNGINQGGGKLSEGLGLHKLKKNLTLISPQSTIPFGDHCIKQRL